MVASVRTQPELRVETPQVVFLGNQIDADLFKPILPLETPYETMYDVAPDGQRFVVVREVRREEAKSSVTVVENWYAEFKDRQR